MTLEEIVARLEEVERKVAILIARQTITPITGTAAVAIPAPSVVSSGSVGTPPPAITGTSAIAIPAPSVSAAGIVDNPPVPEFTETWGENSTDNYTSVTTDTRLNSPSTATNYGTDLSVFTEWEPAAGNQNAALLRFDISSLPADAEVTSATIRLVTKNSPATQVVIRGYENLRTDWERLQATYTVYKTGSSWSTAGARGSGADVTGNPAANSGFKTTWTAAAGSPSGTALVSDDFAAYVQSRIDAQANTIDLVLHNSFEDGQHLNLHSSRGTDGSRPKLTLTYNSATGGGGDPGGPGVTGKFNVFTDGKIYDPDGILMMPRGGSIFPAQPGADPALYSQFLGNPGWRPNLMRLSVLLTSGTPQQPQWSNAQIDLAIDTYTAMGICVIVDWHRISGFPQDLPGSPTMLDTMVTFYNRIATKYKNNPRVWYQTYNEIGDFDDVEQVGGVWRFTPALVTKWVTAATTIIDAVRDAGATSPIVVPCMLAGADIINGTTFNYNIGFAMPVGDRSSVLKHGQTIIDAAPAVAGLSTKNILWDVHLYGNYNVWTANGVGSRKVYLAEFLDELAARGQCVIFGEYAQQIPPGPRFESTKNMHELRFEYGGKYFADLVWDYDGGDPNDLCTSGASSRMGIQNTNNLTTPTNLTNLGKVAWDATHPGTFPPPIG